MYPSNTTLSLMHKPVIAKYNKIIRMKTHFAKLVTTNNLGFPYRCTCTEKKYGVCSGMTF